MYLRAGGTIEPFAKVHNSGETDKFEKIWQIIIWQLQSNLPLDSINHSRLYSIEWLQSLTSMSAIKKRAAGRSILGDAAGLENSRPSRSRRNSFCVSNRTSDQGETPSKPDRRALLEKWRREREANESSGTTPQREIPSPSENKKRNRLHETPPLPPSAPSSTSNTFISGERISARERVRQKKQQKRLHQGDESPGATPSLSTVKSSIEYYDDEEDRAGSRGISGRSPLLRKSLGSARRRSLSLNAARRGRASPALTNESNGKTAISMANYRH